MVDPPDRVDRVDRVDLSDLSDLSDPRHQPETGDAAEPWHHTVDITTPTGHAYRSVAPPLPGTGPPPDAFCTSTSSNTSSACEDVLHELLSLVA